MSDFKSKMSNKKPSVVASIMGVEQPQEETKDKVEVKEESKTTTTSPEPKKEPKIAVKVESEEPKKATDNTIIAYKQVPDENKTVRKNIVLYPSLSKEIDRIIALEKKKNKAFSFNDLVNQVLIEYAMNYEK